MGDVLARPITDKHSFGHVYNMRPEADFALEVGGSAMQGWRRAMEDAHSVVLDVDPDNHANGRWSWFGVFDGHCGRNTAIFAGENLWRVLVRLPQWKSGNITEALREAFLETDRIIQNDTQVQRDGSGSTAVCCLVGLDANGVKKIYCANAGDSRAVLCRAGAVVSLSVDHKPQLESERLRILAAGAFVSMNRVNGNLALSRALGDFDFKSNKVLPPEAQAVSPEPEIEEVTITPDDEFIVIACDGIWDVMTSAEVVSFVRARLQEGQHCNAICEALLNKCIAPSAPGLGCDNMTVMIVDLRGATHPLSSASATAAQAAGTVITPSRAGAATTLPPASASGAATGAQPTA